LLARAFDSLAISLIALPFIAPLLSQLLAHINDKVQLATATGSQANLSDPTTIRLTLTLTALVLVVSFLYEVPQLLRWGQTLGKRIARVRVLRFDGAPQLGLRAVVLRWLVQAAAPQLPWVGIGVWLLDSLWLLWDKPWRQCLHDKAASTIVVSVA
ncbi:MAG: RDD family protein, partial [Mycobacteriales bacterium]